MMSSFWIPFKKFSRTPKVLKQKSVYNFFTGTRTPFRVARSCVSAEVDWRHRSLSCAVFTDVVESVWRGWRYEPDVTRKGHVLILHNASPTHSSRDSGPTHATWMVGNIRFTPLRGKRHNILNHSSVRSKDPWIMSWNRKRNITDPRNLNWKWTKEINWKR